MTDIQRELRQFRYELDDTQQQFAARLGVAISTAVRWELNRPPNVYAFAQFYRAACLAKMTLWRRYWRRQIELELKIRL